MATLSANGTTSSPYQALPPQQSSSHSRSYSQLVGDDHVSNNGTWSGDDSGLEDEDGSRKRKRPMSVSCELCKSRKVKCDRGQPACGWCVRNKQVCEYKERKKPGLRAGYGRELESRLDRLESILMAQGQSIAHLLNATNTSPPRSMLSPPASAAAPEANMFANAPNMIQRGGLETDVPNMSQQSATYPQTPGMMDARAGYIEFDGGYQQATTNINPYPKHDPALHRQDSQNYFANTESPVSAAHLDVKTTISSQDQDLPPYGLLYSLTDLFFKHINTWCPILHRRTTFDSLFGPSSLDEADRILLHAIVATTLRYSTDPHLTPAVRESYHRVSKHKVLLYGMDNSSVRSLQALVILAVDTCGESNGPPGWNLLALVSRAAVQLGLSIEATSAAVSPQIPSIYTLRANVLPEAASWIEDESRRRLFWMIYVLDRHATITTAFDFALDDRDIDRRLPCRDDLYAKNTAVETAWFRSGHTEGRVPDQRDNMGSFSFYVEIVGILSQIHQFLKKPVDISRSTDVKTWRAEYRTLNTDLTSWKESLPPEFDSTQQLIDPSSMGKVVNCGWVMLHATYHTTVIRLHSSAAYPARRSTLFNPSFKASQICAEAVESISSLCAYVKSNGMLNKLGPPFAFSVWVAARLCLVHSATVDHEINPVISVFLGTLRELGTYWHVADRYATLLQRVLDEFAASERAPVTSPDGERQTPSSVGILADMRRCAYDLDFLISRQPRQVGEPTAARLPAANELDYLDLFDFFNMPRIDVHSNGPDEGSSVQGFAFPAQSVENQDWSNPNIAWDASADWFIQQEAA